MAPKKTDTTTPGQDEKQASEARKVFLRENKRPGQLSEEELDLFDAKEIAAWKKDLLKKFETEQANRLLTRDKQNHVAKLHRLRKIIRSEPAVRELLNQKQALELEVDALKAHIADLEEKLKGKG